MENQDINKIISLIVNCSNRSTVTICKKKIKETYVRLNLKKYNYLWVESNLVTSWIMSPYNFAKRKERYSTANRIIKSRLAGSITAVTLRYFSPMKPGAAVATPRHFYRARISAAFHRAMELIKYLSPLGGWTCGMAKLLASWLKSLGLFADAREPTRVELRLHRVISYNNWYYRTRQIIRNRERRNVTFSSVAFLKRFFFFFFFFQKSWRYIISIFAEPNTVSQKFLRDKNFPSICT